ncbi:hypothetical protein D9M68_650330 [compost metagenome]
MRSAAEPQRVLGPSRRAFEEPAGFEHRVPVLVEVKEFMDRRQVLVGVAVEQIDAQCALAGDAVESETEVRDLVEGQAIASFQLQHEHIDGLRLRVTRLLQGRHEAHHVAEQLATRHQLCCDVLHLVRNAVAVQVTLVLQCVGTCQGIHDAEFIAHMDPFKRRECLAGARPARPRGGLLRLGRRSCTCQTEQGRNAKWISPPGRAHAAFVAPGRCKRWTTWVSPMPFAPALSCVHAQLAIECAKRLRSAACFSFSCERP